MLAVVFALALGSASCGSDDDGCGSGDGAAAADVTKDAADFPFEPSTVEVSSGETTIEITNTARPR